MIVLTYSLLVGLLMAIGIYLVLQRSLVRVVLGVTVISNATNLVLFAAGKFRTAPAPILGEADKVLQAPYADPLPQALILTAIVIGFGMISFFVALCYKAYQKLGTDNVDEMRSSES
ncbi:MAG TPA: Na+/H+ antiporter subunit C [Bdellovibrionota bacterium]|jgi:multicomponent Na+:H+ antiporter subunit C|nr:Na+/H+ antiporter subunit C [Bdellovibrionota bacterium]